MMVPQNIIMVNLPNRYTLPAQFAVTISRINKMNKYKNLVDKTFEWTIENMQDERGFFYFQKIEHLLQEFHICAGRASMDVLRNDFLFEEQ